MGYLKQIKNEPQQSPFPFETTIQLPVPLISSLNHHQIGHSVLGQPLGFFTIGSGTKTIILMSGLHGDEIEGQFFLYTLLREFITNPLLQKFKKKWLVIILPIANPDGLILRQRWNFRNVDLNRNFPSSDWTPEALNPRYPPGQAPASEPETQAIINLIKKYKPELVLDCHSFKTAAILPCLPNIGPSFSKLKKTQFDDLIEKWASASHMQVGDEVLGYQTAGGKHTWCQENNIPEITLEIEKGIGQFEIVNRYLPSTLQFLLSFLQC